MQLEEELTNIECINPADTLKLVIYYPRHTTSNIILRNNHNRPSVPLKQTNVIYEFKCQLEN